MAFLVNKQARGRVSGIKTPDFKHQIFWGFFWLLLVGLIGLSVWYVTRFSFFTIENFEISGGETISHSEIESRLRNELNGTYYLLIPKRFSYTYPHDRMIEVLSQNLRMHSISVDRISRSTLKITFEEYIPHALFCSAEVDFPLCYFLTKEGFAFSPAPSLTGGTLVRYTVEGLTEIKKENVIEQQQISDIDTFIDRAEKELDFRITSLIFTKNDDIRFLINGGGMIYVTKGKDFAETFDNVKTVLTSKEFKHIRPGNFNYVDARFGNKIYVNEEMGTSTESELGLSE